MEDNKKKQQRVEHSPLGELSKKIAELEMDPSTPKRGEIYKHYKGTQYVVLCMSLREEDELPCVVYFGVTSFNDGIWPWTRPLSDWNSTVEVDGKQVPRFEKTTNKYLFKMGQLM